MYAKTYAGGTRPKPKVKSVRELMETEFPEVRYAVPGIIPEGVSLLAGKPKLGKSWLALGLCIAVASGGYALGKKPVEMGGALYLALEDNDRRMQRRIKKMLNGEPAPEGFAYATEWARIHEGGAEDLDEYLAENQDTRLVVIDTLAKVRTSGGGQNVYREDYEALEPLLPIAAKHGVSIVVVTHLRKMAAADPLDEISGSTGLSGGVDGVLVLKRDRGKADAYLHVTGRDIEEESELALRWDNALASWSLMGDAEEHRLAENPRKILTVLKATTEYLGPKEIARRAELDYDTTRQTLGRMQEADNPAARVVSPSRGKYTYPDNPTYVHNVHNVHNANTAHNTHNEYGFVEEPFVSNGAFVNNVNTVNRGDGRDPLAHRDTAKAKFYAGGDS